MFTMAAKAGFGVVLILTVWGMIQANAVTDAMIALLAAGLLPGTNLAIPAELVLLAAAWVFVRIVRRLLQDYSAHRALIGRLMQQYDQGAQDPSYSRLFPRFRRLALASRSLRFSLNDRLLEVHFWLAHFGRPVWAQIVTTSKEAADLFMDADRWAVLGARYREAVRDIGLALQEWFDKARAYFVRMIF